MTRILIKTNILMKTMNAKLIMIKNTIKVLVDDPFNNRNLILNVTKSQKGIYIWETLDSKHMYVGHSINL